MTRAHSRSRLAKRSPSSAKNYDDVRRNASAGDWHCTTIILSAQSCHSTWNASVQSRESEATSRFSSYTLTPSGCVKGSWLSRGTAYQHTGQPAVNEDESVDWPKARTDLQRSSTIDVAACAVVTIRARRAEDELNRSTGQKSRESCVFSAIRRGGVR